MSSTEGKQWRVAGVNFDHFHMGDLLRMVHAHPNAEIVAVLDEQPERMLEAPFQNPVQYFLHCLGTGTPVEGPLSVEISRIGQQITDTAYRIAREKRTLPLVE